ncbi:MAG TPA: hypothetical protein VFS29_11840, partial [Motilibacteraceae bacterium]|nr:hypothetical protein [Motilibacteraceae bacterium]
MNGERLDGGGGDEAGALVLVVDDDPQLRAAVARALRLDGHLVDAVGDGAAALAAVRERSPDAV